MQIFSRFSILFTVFNQIRLKNYQIKTNKIFNFSHKISQKRHFVAQKRLFLYEIRDFSRKMPVFSNEWLSKTIIVKKYGVIFSPNPDSPAAYRGNAHLEKPRDSRSPGSGGASTCDAFSVCRGTTKKNARRDAATPLFQSKRF